MSIECGECERDLRGGHDDTCSRAWKCPECKTAVSRKNVPKEKRAVIEHVCQCGKTFDLVDE